MTPRYTFNGLAADVRIANRYLLDHPKPGCYFYTLGQSYGRTQLYQSCILTDGTICQHDHIESGSPKDCRIAMFSNPLAGYMHRGKRINRLQAAGMLQVCSDIMQHDSSDTVCSSDMETVVNMARACKYRKPANAPGSLGRMFFESCQRAIATAKSASPWAR